MNKQELIDKINEDELSIQFSNLEEKEKIVKFFEGEDFDCSEFNGFEEGFIEHYDEEQLFDFKENSCDIMTFTEFLEVIETKS